TPLPPGQLRREAGAADVLLERVPKYSVAPSPVKATFHTSPEAGAAASRGGAPPSRKRQRGGGEGGEERRSGQCLTTTSSLPRTSPSSFRRLRLGGAFPGYGAAPPALPGRTAQSAQFAPPLGKVGGCEGFLREVLDGKQERAENREMRSNDS